MNQIHTVEHIRPLFADCLMEVMEEKGLFNPATHTYLTDLMMQYSHWEPDENELAPMLHTEIKQPLIDILRGAGGTFSSATDKTSRYLKMKRVADALLFAIGYWPESLMPAERKARPPLDYYADKGIEAYSIAYSLTRKDVMITMARGFNQYTSTIADVKEKLLESAIKDVLFNPAIVIADQSEIERYLRNPNGKIMKKEKN